MCVCVCVCVCVFIYFFFLKSENLLLEFNGLVVISFFFFLQCNKSSALEVSRLFGLYSHFNDLMQINQVLLKCLLVFPKSFQSNWQIETT